MEKLKTEDQNNKYISKPDITGGLPTPGTLGFCPMTMIHLFVSCVQFIN